MSLYMEIVFSSYFCVINVSWHNSAPALILSSSLCMEVWIASFAEELQVEFPGFDLTMEAKRLVMQIKIVGSRTKL